MSVHVDKLNCLAVLVACRLHEALELVKDMARSHRYTTRPSYCLAPETGVQHWDVSK